MDAIDKQCWIEIGQNCRHSYRSLADKIGISSNAVMQRVAELLETGVIQKWYLTFRPAMIDAQFAFIEVKTDGSQDEEMLLKTLGTNPMVFCLFPLTTGDFALHAFYIGAATLLELTSFIRSVHGVIDVKVHPTTASAGRKMKLEPLYLRTLPWLAEDPRASISDIARLSGLTARRVKRLVDELVESDAFDFSFVWNPNAREGMAFISRLTYDSKVTQPEAIDREIREVYPLEYFYSHISAVEPVIFSVFMVDHLSAIQDISRRLRKLPGVRALSTMTYYSATVLDSLTRIRMIELLSES